MTTITRVQISLIPCLSESSDIGYFLSDDDHLDPDFVFIQAKVAGVEIDDIVNPTKPNILVLWTDVLIC